MNVDDPIYYAFLAVFLVIAGSFALRAFKFGGLRAGLFGAPIERTVGEVTATVSSLSATTVALRVHVLGGPPARAFGLEVAAKSVRGYRVVPICLSATEARNLLALLQTAISTAPHAV